MEHKKLNYLKDSFKPVILKSCVQAKLVKKVNQKSLNLLQKRDVDWMTFDSTS